MEKTGEINNLKFGEGVDKSWSAQADFSYATILGMTIEVLY